MSHNNIKESFELNKHHSLVYKPQQKRTPGRRFVHRKIKGFFNMKHIKKIESSPQQIINHEIVGKCIIPYKDLVIIKHKRYPLSLFLKRKAINKSEYKI